jgi:hypothetical protein
MKSSTESWGFHIPDKTRSWSTGTRTGSAAAGNAPGMQQGFSVLTARLAGYTELKRHRIVSCSPTGPPSSLQPLTMCTSV